MRILPVLDLMGGVVVRGVAGRRAEYRPVVSRLTASCRPLDVAGAFRSHFGLTELYLADLDAIAGAAPALSVYGELRAAGFRLWVDAGLRTPEAESLVGAGVEGIVAGLETLPGPETLARLCRDWGERIVFSLDLKEGRPLGTLDGWQAADAWSVAAAAVAAGVRRLLVLDLARVGVGAGSGTEELCGRLVRTYPGLEVAAGGGVRDRADLERLRAAGVRAVLVASALHDGRLSREDLTGAAR
jgi:phosphoribosylformimino-5-aminoimidazole carboxamide ribotide isomerase